jgi:hypothetical protein
MWFEYPELLLLFLIACVCSLYLILNVRPVCPIYFNEQSIHLIWYTPLSSYSSRCGWGFTRFCIVFLVWNVILIFASLKIWRPNSREVLFHVFITVFYMDGRRKKMNSYDARDFKQDCSYPSASGSENTQDLLNGDIFQPIIFATNISSS